VSLCLLGAAPGVFIPMLTTCSVIPNFMFMGACIVVYFYRKTNQDTQLFRVYWISLYMFRTVFPSIIRSPRLYVQHQVYVLQVRWLLTSGPEIFNKLEKVVRLVGFTIEIPQYQFIIEVPIEYFCSKLPFFNSLLFFPTELTQPYIPSRLPFAVSLNLSVS
jgi:hypothetical protein